MWKGFQRLKDTHTLTVIEQSGYKYKPTPTLILKGDWLASFGFSMGTKVSVSCTNGQLVITPSEEQNKK